MSHSIQTFLRHAPKSLLTGLGVFAFSLLTGCSATTDLASPSVGDPVLAEPIIAEIAAEPAPVVADRSTSSGAANPRRGVLTAGDIDDARNLGALQRYLNKARRETKLPTSNLNTPVLAQLANADGTPAPGVYVTLRKPGAAEPFYTGYSGVDGHITVFPAVIGAGRLAQVELRAFPRGQGTPHVQRLKTGGKRHGVALPFDSTNAPEFLDLAFVVDTTGSMADELAWLTKELGNIVNKAKRAAPGVDVRFGLVVYRDEGDEYVVRNYGFTKRQSVMNGWLRKQTANGGGDYPEAAAAALAAGAGLNWRKGNGERLMFHIADAPPHNEDARAYLAAASKAARANVQIFGLGASGVAAESEYLMRQAAVQTNGRYMFLTDDSGVGYSHQEPTVPCYQVTLLNNLMLRVLKSELSGRRIDAAPGQIIRSVGNSVAGYCRN